MVEEQSRFVELSDGEMATAASVAARLHESLRKKGVRNAHGLKNNADTLAMEAGGAQAELAASKFFGVSWSASLPGHDASGPDIGERTQVRSSNKPRSSHHLLVRVRDIEKYGNVPFVLVIQTGRTFEVKGWAMSYDVVEKGRCYDDNGRPPVFMLHESKLKPADTLHGEGV